MNINRMRTVAERIILAKWLLDENHFAICNSIRDDGNLDSITKVSLFMRLADDEYPQEFKHQLLSELAKKGNEDLMEQYFQFLDTLEVEELGQEAKGMDDQTMGESWRHRLVKQYHFLNPNIGNQFLNPTESSEITWQMLERYFDNVFHLKDRCSSSCDVMVEHVYYQLINPYRLLQTHKEWRKLQHELRMLISTALAGDECSINFILSILEFQDVLCKDLLKATLFFVAPRYSKYLELPQSGNHLSLMEKIALAYWQLCCRKESLVIETLASASTSLGNSENNKEMSGLELTEIVENFKLSIYRKEVKADYPFHDIKTEEII